MKYKELASKETTEGSAVIRERVAATRRIQQERFGDEKIYSNAQMTPRLIRKYCGIDDACHRLLENAITKMGLSARAFDRILKVARTIADLEHCEHIATPHISEAIQYRSLDRNYWA